MPRVSVLIPVFNSDAFLDQAIRSVLSQSFEDFELLLLDDGSDDRSRLIAAAAARRDARVVVADGPHGGVVYQRNRGVALAKAGLIALMDADDLSLPDRLARQVQFMDANPDCVAVGAQALRIDEDGLPINVWRVPERHEQIDARHMAGVGGSIINPTALIRKDAIHQVGGYRAGFAEDYDLFLRLAEIGRLANLPDVLLRYRLHTKSLTWARAEHQRRAVQKALQDAWGRRGLEGAPPTLEIKTPSQEELMWEWARASFDAGHFRTTANQALKLLRRRPSEPRRWALLGAACLGPLGTSLMQQLPEHLPPPRQVSPTPENR